jgi:hypothetical protein
MIQLQNLWADLDETWYERYAMGLCSKIVFSDFLQSVLPTWWANELVKWNRQ